MKKKGAKTLLIVTKGFKDLLEIGTQQRPNIFSLNIVKPLQLYHDVIEVEERLDASGKVLTPLENAALQKLVKYIKDNSFEAVAISLLHAYKNPIHELVLKKGTL